MLNTFFDALILMFIGAALGGFLSLIVVLPVARLVKRYTRVPEKRRRKVAIWTSVVFMVALALLELVMHFRMKRELEPLATNFAATAYEEGQYMTSDPLDDIVTQRDRLLNERGYVCWGQWWAKWVWEGESARIDTDALYIYIPFL